MDSAQEPELSDHMMKGWRSIWVVFLLENLRDLVLKGKFFTVPVILFDKLFQKVSVYY